MSDGNFNRNLLPTTSYRSGLRAGQMTMRTRALEAMRSLLGRLPLTDEQRAEALAEFSETLRKE